MKVRFNKILLLYILSLQCFASVTFADLRSRINEIISSDSQKKVRYTVKIINADTGKTLYRRNDKKPFIPASNMKLITTAAALEFLGPDFQYQTTIGIDNNSLKITGSGDPLLGDDVTDQQHGREEGWILEKVTDALKNANIKEINDIIIDTTIFDDVLVHLSWPRKELNRWYACEVCGFNYNGNCIELAAENNGGNIILSVKPNTSFLDVINKVKPIQKGRGAIGSYRRTNINEIVVYGRCKKKQGPVKIAIQRPAAFFAYLLAEHLNNNGVKVRGQFLEKKLDKKEDNKILFTLRNEIKDVFSRCNKNSFGLAAEALMKTIAAYAQPQNLYGSWEKGRDVISKYLVRLGVEADEFYIDDGSGLSKKNRLSANTITTVLLDVYKSRNWSVYRDSLAVGGIDGTIDRYFNEAKYKGKILGKTGYLKVAKSFSGVCETGRKVILFSIIANNANGTSRQAINEIAEAIIDGN